MADRCGKWMPRKKDFCARKARHAGDCRSESGLADNRRAQSGRRRGVRRRDDPAARKRWRVAYRFNRLGITEEQFNAMLERQGHACAICRVPFGDKRICADHDHSCCPPSDYFAKTCGKCIRGLLCVRCNTRLEWVQKYGDAVAAYLGVDRRGLEPLASSV